MKANANEAAILTEHEGEEMVLSNGKAARIKPFSVEDLFSDELVVDLEKIGKALWSQAKVLLDSGQINADSLAGLDVMGAFRASKDSMKRCLMRCVDLPLKAVPGPDLPRVLEVFVRQNFSAAQLQSWADLMKSLAAVTKGMAVSSTSATSPKSSASTGTPAGDASPPPSSNTGSGAASAAT